MQMAKKLLAVFLAALFVLPGLGALYMPACAQDGVEIIIVPDKTVAAPGETVTYTVSIGPVSYLKTGSIILQVPEGLTFVPFSESELNELNGKLANVFTNAGPVYYENSTRSVVFNSQGYSSSEPTELMQFRCTVADNASGELTVGIDGGHAFTFNKYYDLAFPTYDPSKSAVTIRVPEVSFYVPEAVYLKTGEHGTQWYLNSCGDNGVRPPAPKDTTGKLYFHCDGATDIRITSDGAVVNLISTGTDTIADNDFQIVDNGKRGLITYTATYMAGGMTRTAKAYTYIYMPNRVPTGCATEAESKKHDGNYDYLGFLTALWGAQEFDMKENTSDTDGADVADESIYLGNHGLVKSQNHKPRKSGMVSAGNGTFGAHNNNDINLSVTSPTAYFFVDTSRFTNMKDIPNMYVGLTMTDDEHTDYSKFTTYLAAGHTSGQTKPACIAPIIPETQENGERVIRQEGECTIDYDVSALQSTETDFTVFTYGYSYCDTGSGYETKSYQHTHFQIRACNKNDLRVLYRDEMRNNYFRQKSFYESEDDWARYEAYMEEAAIVLGSPDVRPDSIRNCCNNLSEAIDGFKAKAPSITRTKTAREGVNGYWVYAQVETNGGADIEKVQFPTWTDKNGQDDIQKNWETNSAAFGTFGAWSVDGQQYNYMYYVDVSDHNNEYAGYNTHVYAYNVAGASAHAEADKVNFDYTVRFEGCGATGGSVAAQTVIYGESVTLPSVEREGYMFLGWAETANADAPQYQSGKTFKPSKDTTLYAVWGVAAPTKAINLVSGKAETIKGAQESSVWFGNYMQSSADSKEPVKWRVLENKDGKLFLLSDQNLDVFEYNKEYTSVTWETCDMRSWLNGYGATTNSGGNDYTGDSFKGDTFSAAEFAAVADSELENADNLKWSTSGGANTTDKVFLLSFADATNTAYGFLNKVDSTDTRKATNTAYTAGGGKTGSDNMSADGKTDHWWLRTPGSYSVYAVDISDSGFIHEYGLTVSSDDVPVRPALNIDLGKVLFTSAAENGKPGGGLTAVESYDGDDWKLTVLDDSRSGFTAFCTKDEGGVRTIKYSGAKTGENEKISAMIVDADGIVTYYGVLCDAEAGQNTITLNVSVKLGDGDKLYVFNEQANGDYKTDYASALVDVTTSVISYTATFKADGKVVGTVYFTAGTASIKDMEPAVPAKTGHTGKWPAYTLGAEDITIEAVYTPNTYTATAVADGQVLAKIPFTYGQKSVQLPEIPKKEGYTAAWPSYTLGDRDITITAVYTPIQYTATFVADGEVVGTELFIVTQESIHEPAVPEKEGYTGAWAPYVLGAKNITIEAVYTPITYTVYWIVDGKTTSVSVPFGSAIEKPADPQKDGYTFTGWDAAIPATMPAHDLTFTAQFEKIAVTLTGLTVKKAPDKTVYTYRNDKSLDLAGLELEATYSDGSTQAVDPAACSITGYSPKPAGEKTITVEYEGQTAQFKVNVKLVWWQWLIRIFLLGFIWY